MKVSVVPIGNSRGIRLPKAILEQLQISDQVELEVENKQIVLRPINKSPRSDDRTRDTENSSLPGCFAE